MCSAPHICGSSHLTRNAESLYARGNQVLCLARLEAVRCSARLEQNARSGEGQAAASATIPPQGL